MVNLISVIKVITYHTEVYILLPHAHVQHQLCTVVETVYACNHSPSMDLYTLDLNLLMTWNSKFDELKRSTTRSVKEDEKYNRDIIYIMYLSNIVHTVKEST